MSVRSLVRVLTSIVDTELPPLLATKTVFPSRVIACGSGLGPTGISMGFLVRVFTSIVETVSPTRLPTKAVLPSGVNTIPSGGAPTGMSVGFLVRLFPSIHDPVPPPLLPQNGAARQGVRAGIADPPPRTTSAPANSSTTTTRTGRESDIAAPCLAVLTSSRWADRASVRRAWALRIEPTSAEPRKPIGGNRSRPSQPARATEVINDHCSVAHNRGHPRGVGRATTGVLCVGHHERTMCAVPYAAAGSSR